ncbi:MAG: undecaprenyldiphospho-muramoylpentapeptide beta-N-acetylglucosaminyltransferase [Patescibacteria group bacterium]
MSYNKVKKILLTGGGTGGSVSPLLAIVDEIQNAKTLSVKGDTECQYDFLWLGTKDGPEREMVKKVGIEFKTIAGGKLRRYFSWKNFIDVFKVKIGFFQAIFIILKWKPGLVMSAGSFISVPVIWAAWLLRVKVLIHQQDARPGLANKLMAPFADKITVTFKDSLMHYGKKATWIGNPVRLSIDDCRLTIEKIKKYFNLDKGMPVVLMVGGGTGAKAINELIYQSLDELVKFCQVVHVTGKNKKIQKHKNTKTNYYTYEFLDAQKMAGALRVADVVVSRCGLGLLTELSYLGKPSILIPMPDTHQEDNAKIFKEKEAAIVLDQSELTAEEFIDNIKKLLNDKILRELLGKNISDVMKKEANERMVKIVEHLVNK